MRAYIGIDPGKCGCLAILREDEQVEFYDWPKDGDISTYFETILEQCSKYEIRMAVLERVHAMPKQGVSSTFSFGVYFGMWQSFLAMSKMKHMLVPPQVWSKGLISKADGPDPKARARVVAMRLFPKAQLSGAKGGYKDGRGDALLMAYYASQKDNKPKKKEKPRRRS